ncbi:hypothetical protein [Motiliproteus sp. MSK22-1]|uniref:hypothetical protein n=1 Tax=Motiliproteus sp. MSK22-1 TaxID=1897630 RepID=UPI0009773721|nr:hypothetical protein [Motiliproteus sp. MSK22-1]OMH32184.1 hypothetical protein BGP75_15950 [Motiliproteus sp. MSK22-1]
MNNSWMYLLVAVGFSFALQAQADDNTVEYCESAAELAKQGQNKEALEEARWCVEGLEQELQALEKELFSKTIGDWKRGEVRQNKGMGMFITETSYTRDNMKIDMTLTGGSGAMAAAMAQIGMMQGGKRVRLGKHRGVMTPKGELSVKLNDGRMLMFKSRNAGADELQAFAKQFPVADLDGS